MKGIDSTPKYVRPYSDTPPSRHRASFLNNPMDTTRR